MITNTLTTCCRLPLFIEVGPQVVQISLWSPVIILFLSLSRSLSLCLPSSKGRTGRASSISSVGSEPSPALSVLSLDALVAPETPIQFDIISPVSEENSGQSKTAPQSSRYVSVRENDESLFKFPACVSQTSRHHNEAIPPDCTAPSAQIWRFCAACAADSACEH